MVIQKLAEEASRIRATAQVARNFPITRLYVETGRANRFSIVPSWNSSAQLLMVRAGMTMTNIQGIKSKRVCRSATFRAIKLPVYMVMLPVRMMKTMAKTATKGE